MTLFSRVLVILGVLCGQGVALEEGSIVHAALPAGEVVAKVERLLGDDKAMVRYDEKQLGNIGGANLAAAEVSLSGLSPKVDSVAAISTQQRVYFLNDKKKSAVGAVVHVFENGRVLLYPGSAWNKRGVGKSAVWRNAEELSPPVHCVGAICTKMRVVSLDARSCKDGTVNFLFANGMAQVECQGFLGSKKWRHVNALTTVPR